MNALLKTCAVEEKQFDSCGVFGINTEIDAVRLTRGSERKALSFPYTNIRRLAHRFTAATGSAALRAE